jgi:hypothetical protein
LGGKGITKDFVEGSVQYLRKLVDLYAQSTSSLVQLYFKIQEKKIVPEPSPTGELLTIQDIIKILQHRQGDPGNDKRQQPAIQY